jgi:hypothetical protein
MDLATWQAEFLAAVLKPASPTGPVSAGLAVYRGNARGNFHDALAQGYPVLRTILGAEEFRQLAWSFQRVHPSRSGNLFHLGGALPEFLARLLPGTPDEDLIDLARLEWAAQRVLVAADDLAPLDLVGLGAVPDEQRPAVRFVLQPALQWLTTGHAVFEVWDTVRSGRVPVRPARRRAEWLVLDRQAVGVRVQSVDELDLALLEAIATGDPLGELALRRPDDDLGSRLVRCARAGWLAGFHLQNP